MEWGEKGAFIRNGNNDFAGELSENLQRMGVKIV